MSLASRYKREKQSAQRHLQAGSELYETAVGPIEAASRGEGPAVLLSHGGGGGYDMGHWLAQLIGGPFTHSCCGQILFPTTFLIVIKTYRRSFSPSPK